MFRDLTAVSLTLLSFGVGQTYRASGWTVTDEAGRARLTNDDSGHGLLLNVVNWRAF